jgi:hypothetical protein
MPAMDTKTHRSAAPASLVNTLMVAPLRIRWSIVVATRSVNSTHLGACELKKQDTPDRKSSRNASLPLETDDFWEAICRP